MRSVFVAGTDTGVGKTVVAGALARTAARAGCRTGVFKPFAAGGTGDAAALGAALAGAARRAGDPGSAARCSYAFKAPASPYTAARLEGRDVDVGAVLDEFARMRREFEAVVVEGIGGTMAPIRRDYFVADLIRDMGVPSIIVTTNGFDAPGHSAMAASACRRRGAHVAGFVVNRIEEYGYRGPLLRREIRAVTGLPVLASVGRSAVGGVGMGRGGRRNRGGVARAPGGGQRAGPGSGAAGSARAAIGASKRGDVDGAASIIFGREGGGEAAARWRRQSARRRRLRRMRRARGAQ